MRWLSPILLAVVGLIHLLPVTGALGAPQLQRLYGVSVGDPNLLVLMQHRAVLFAIVGGLLLAAAFKPAWRTLAIAVGVLSVGSFLLIAWSVGGYGAPIRKIVWIDAVALGMLVVAALPEIRLMKTGAPTKTAEATASGALPMDPAVDEVGAEVPTVRFDARDPERATGDARVR